MSSQSKKSENQVSFRLDLRCPKCNYKINIGDTVGSKSSIATSPSTPTSNTSTLPPSASTASRSSSSRSRNFGSRRSGRGAYCSSTDTSPPSNPSSPEDAPRPRSPEGPIPIRSRISEGLIPVEVEVVLPDQVKAKSDQRLQIQRIPDFDTQQERIAIESATLCCLPRPFKKISIIWKRPKKEDFPLRNFFDRLSKFSRRNMPHSQSGRERHCPPTELEGSKSHFPNWQSGPSQLPENAISEMISPGLGDFPQLLGDLHSRAELSASASVSQSQGLKTERSENLPYFLDGIPIQPTNMAATETIPAARPFNQNLPPLNTDARRYWQPLPPRDSVPGNSFITNSGNSFNQSLGDRYIIKKEDDDRSPFPISARSQNSNPVSGSERLCRTRPPPTLSINDLMRNLLERYTEQEFQRMCQLPIAKSLLGPSSRDWTIRGLSCLRRLLTGSQLYTPQDVVAYRFMAGIFAKLLKLGQYSRYERELAADGWSHLERFQGLHFANIQSWIQLWTSSHNLVDFEDISLGSLGHSLDSVAPGNILNNASERAIQGGLKHVHPSSYIRSPEVQPAVGIISDRLSEQYNVVPERALEASLQFLLIYCGEGSHWQPKTRSPLTPDQPDDQGDRLCSLEVLKRDVLDPLRSRKQFQTPEFQGVINSVETSMPSGGTIAQLQRRLHQHVASSSKIQPDDCRLWRFLSITNDYCRAVDQVNPLDDVGRFTTSLDALISWYGRGSNDHASSHYGQGTPASATNHHGMSNFTSPVQGRRARKNKRAKQQRSQQQGPPDPKSTLTKACDICKKIFKGKWRQGNLNRHRKYKHFPKDQDQGELTCDYCNQKLGRPDNRIKHEERCPFRPPDDEMVETPVSQEQGQPQMMYGNGNGKDLYSPNAVMY